MQPIFERYKDQSQKAYSSLTSIQQHQPQILKPEGGDGIEVEETKGDKQITLYAGDGMAEFSKPGVSKLFAPTVLLTGHEGEVFSVKFNSKGTLLASAGFDKQIFLWDVYNKCINTCVLRGHTNAILDLHWSTDGSKIYTASADKTLAAWDVETKKRLKKFIAHTSFVNSCHPARRGLDVVVTGSDDSTAKIWDLRARTHVNSFAHKYPVLSVSFNDTAEKLLTGGIDNQIRLWDIRKNDVEYGLAGHTDSITGLALSHEGSYLLSNSMDQMLRVWDIRPFVSGSRCLKTFTGLTHSFEKCLLRTCWNSDGSLLSAGSADK